MGGQFRKFVGESQEFFPEEGIFLGQDNFLLDKGRSDAIY